MSNDMVPCLAPALCSLAKRQQSLDEVIARPGLIQVERFQTYRATPEQRTSSTDANDTATHDETQIIAWVMDSRCKIRVFFDNQATDRIEKATGERVTSYLRSLVYLRSYKFAILPPNSSTSSKKDYQTSRHRHNPELVLHAYDWQKYIGSRDDPLYHEEATYLLSDFTQYPVDGDQGRVPPHYGKSADDAIWRKQENGALIFLKSQWESMRSNGKASSPPSTEALGVPPMRTRNRQELMSIMHTGMNEVQQHVFKEIRVFGIDPLEELDLAEIQKVLMLNGVKVIPEEEPPQAPIVPKEEPAEPIRRRRACRKSTGKKPPRTFNSPSTKPVAAASPPPATQPLMTRMPQYMDDKVATSDQETSRRHDPADSRKRKRKVVDFFSSTSPEPRSNFADNQRHGSQDAMETGEGQKPNQVSVKGEPAASSPLRSPPLAGLVTQLPVSSMDVEEESPPSEPLLATQQVTKFNLEMDIDLSPPEADTSAVLDIEMDDGTTGKVESLRSGRHVWELGEDEEGLSDAEIDLEALLGS